jgi:hypothetical protein
MNDSPASLREASSLLAICAFIFGIGAYLAQANHVPVIDTCLFGLSSILYGWIPALSSLKIPQAPEVLSSLVAAILFYLAGIPFTPAIARMCGPRIGEMENQMRSRQRKPRHVKIQ